MRLRKRNPLSLKRYLFPARRQSENAGPRLFGFTFRCCPPSRIFFQCFELSTKAAFAKAAFDTLQLPVLGFTTSKPLETDLFSRVLFFFSFLPPLLATPLPPLLSALFHPRKVICSVERRAQHRAWRGAVSGRTSPKSSGRKFLPEICVKKKVGKKKTNGMGRTWTVARTWKDPEWAPDRNRNGHPGLLESRECLISDCSRPCQQKKQIKALLPKLCITKLSTTKFGRFWAEGCCH